MKEEMEVEKEQVGTDFFRSYYKDYILAETVGPDGIARNEFVYNGKRYGPAVSGGCFLLLKLTHSVFFCVMLSGIVLSNLIPVAFNISKVAAVPMFVLIFMMVLRLFALFFYWSAPLKMREWDHRHGPKRLRGTSLLCAVANFALFVTYLVLMVVTRTYSVDAVKLLLLQFPSTLSAFAAYQIEKKLDYAGKTCAD